MASNRQVTELLLLWDDLRAQGRKISAQELCQECPECVAEVARRIHALQEMYRRLETGGPDDNGAAGPLAETASGPWPTVNGYEIVGKLGRGGMGVVYKARQVGLERWVALKMLAAGAQADQEQLHRFRTEAEAVARLQHPNIVQIYEVGEQDGRPYMALEHVDGGSLARKLAGTPLPARQAARVTETLALAVHFAHQQGIVHRDLTPANVLLTADGAPKISDFGLAKFVISGGKGQTQSGAVLGTPSYMAPEQAEGKAREVGPGTDIYALGAILYELLTGRPPFEAETPLDTLRQVVSEEPVPPGQLQAKLPRDLETICLKCLAKEPAQRYRTAGELAADLKRWLVGEPIQARPVGAWERAVKWARRRPAVAALVGVTVVAAGVLLVTGLIYNARLRLLLEELAARQAALDRANAAVEREQQAARDASWQAQARLERVNRADGLRHLGRGDLGGALTLFAEAIRTDPGDPERQEANRIRFRATLQQFPRPVHALDHQDKVSYAEFSPDGRYLVTAGDDRVARLWDTATGQALGPPLPHTAAVWHATFSPDGRRVLTAGTDKTARVWDVATGQPLTPPLPHDGTV
jgi:predicted Ser/Thr protein kinase